jgi:LmbE family N-acetylglucosaminyl deacetylase
MLVIGGAGLAISRILCIGAHSDDIEIGCGGTVLKLIASQPGLAVDWIILSATDDREREGKASADRFLDGASEISVRVAQFRERYLHFDPSVKEYFDGLGGSIQPDIVFAPWSLDAHQDHRLAAELAANTFRDQLILEYEIPKYDGDLGRPSVYVHLSAEQADTKVQTILEAFPSQRDRPWFTADTFTGLMRLRGIESRSPGGYAEAFHCRKLVLA